MKLVIASNNENKVRELKGLLCPYFDEIVSTKDMGFNADIEENGQTFRENAVIKARAVARALGCAALADDSGLCVDALCGRPGVMSSRYAGEHGNDMKNNLKLLKEMEDIEERSCRFMCAVALAYPDGRCIVSEGSCEGVLLKDFKGNNGFGYDSLFYSRSSANPSGWRLRKKRGGSATVSGQLMTLSASYEEALCVFGHP